MKLENPFSNETRLLFADAWMCWECGSNGNKRGGLELHHITGRDSSSPFNAAVLCKVCHEKVGHTDEEEKYYFAKTIAYLLEDKENKFKVGQREEDFLARHAYLVHNNPVYDNVMR